MLRFIKQNLETISGIEIFPLISLVIFVLFFVIMLVRVFKMKKTYVSEISDYPLNDSDDEEIFQQQN